MDDREEKTVEMLQFAIKWGVVLIISLTALYDASCIASNISIEALVAHGASPLEAECAIKNDSLTFCVGLIGAQRK
jgi:hypothetical protein